MVFKYSGNKGIFSGLLVFLIIAILAAASIYILLTFDVLKLYPYILTNIGSEEAPSKSRVYFDLDGNGKSELFFFMKYTSEDVVEYYDENKLFVDVIRPGGYYLNKRPSYFFGDADRDGFAEIYLFTLKNDSILINGYELMGDDGHFVEDFLIDRVNGVEGINDFYLLEPRIADVNFDGSQELIFIIRAGYSLNPRKVYSFNPQTFKLNKSKKSAAAYSGFQIYSLPGIEGESIITACNSVENYAPGDDIAFNDNSGWLIAYNYSLDKTLIIKEYPEKKTNIQTCIHETKDGAKIYNLVYEAKSGRSYLERLSLEGHVEKSAYMTQDVDSYTLMNYFSQVIEQIVVYHSDTLFKFSNDLEIVSIEPKVGSIKFSAFSGVDNFIEQSGIFLFGRGDKLILRDQNLRIIGKLEMPGFEKESSYTISVKDSAMPGDYTISVSGNSYAQLFTMSQNSFFRFRYAIIFLLFLAFNLFFYLLFRLQNYSYNRRFMLQSRITSLQLQTVQNQLQPHFTFNMLNTIGSMIYKNEKDKAYEYLNYFSDMLRTTLLSRSMSDWQIDEELNFIGAYMVMENLRFDNKFRFIQNIEKDADLTNLVPKLTIQAFVENSIRHGLIHKEGECILTVAIRQTADHMTIMVEDNGIGREAAAKLPRQQNGLGNNILQDYINVYNRTNKIKFILSIEDLMGDNGKAEGTRVIFQIPVNFNSNIL